MALLDVRGVNFSYDGVVSALDDVSLSVASGSIVGLIGPNGSGKSTLIKTVFDLLQLQSGSVVVDGHPHGSTSAKAAGIYLASNDYLPQFLTAGEYFDLLGKLYGTGVDEQLANDLFTKFSMQGRLGDLIEDYSHGMRKKTQLVSSLLMRRPLTVIDETLNGIDIEAMFLVEKELRTLRAEGHAVLLCTHDFALLERLADRVVFLDLGQVVLEGDTPSLVAEHGSLSTMVSVHLEQDARLP